MKQRLNLIKKKLEIASDVKTHGGPMHSPEEVDRLVQKLSHDKDALTKAIALELNYQKKVIVNNCVPESRYRERVKDKNTGRMHKIPIAERIENLKAIVRPLEESPQFCIVDANQFVSKATAKHNEMKQFYSLEAIFNPILSNIYISI